MKLLLSLLLTAQFIFAQGQSFYLNPRAAISTSIGQLFKSVEFIPLETTRHSTFSRPDAMVVTGNYYIILDQTQQTVFFFDKGGKFVAKFNSRDEEILNMQFIPSQNKLFLQTRKRGYAFTEKQKISIIRDGRTDYYKVWMCDLNIPGNYAFHVVKDFQYPGYALFLFSKNEFLASATFSEGDLPDHDEYELKHIRDNSIVQNFFSYNQRYNTLFFNHIGEVAFFSSSNKSETLFTRPYHYDIYAYHQGQVVVKYRFIFPLSQSLPADFFQRDLSGETSWEILRKEHQGAIQNIFPVASWNHYLVFWLSTLQPNNGKDFREYLLDLNTQTLINARLIDPDSISYNLPVNFTGVIAEDSASLYTYMFADELTDNIKKNNQTYPAILQSIAEKAISHANPIIVRLIGK